MHLLIHRIWCKQPRPPRLTASEDLRVGGHTCMHGLVAQACARTGISCTTRPGTGRLTPYLDMVLGRGVRTGVHGLVGQGHARGLDVS